MQPTLLIIPLHEWIAPRIPALDFVPDIPIRGYGLMLMCAFIFCQVLARYLCRREGIDGNHMLDLAIWLFVPGIIAARTLFVVEYWDKFRPFFWHTFKDNTLYQIIALWDGGLVFYGSAFGGAVGYFSYHHLYLRPQGVSHWKMLDVMAPCIALGLALGRIGCLFTGCCYGNVACGECPALHFPLYSPPAMDMIARGYQTPLGFLLENDTMTVKAVEPDAAAAAAGLQPRDLILEINDRPVLSRADIASAGSDVKMLVLRNGNTQLISFRPTSIGLTPTQVYETISMALLLFFLLSYYPFRRHDGELMVFLMLGYGVHRFLNEMLRTDNEVVAFGLTLSQNISLAVIASGIVLAYFVWRQPPLPNVHPTGPQMQEWVPATPRG